MSITLPTTGQSNRDLLNLALASLGKSIWQPNDYGRSPTPPPWKLDAQRRPRRCGRMRHPAAASRAITNLHIVVTIAGITHRRPVVPRRSTAGTRLAVSADQASTWESTGFKTAAMTSPYAAAAGDYFVAIVTNGATTPTLAQESSLATFAANAGLTAGASAFAMSGPAAQTSLPASINMASEVATIANTYWFGAS
jgi:hypothetical protein